ncbi:sigma-70 family RNA polymerase sigma factor [soil metagenome]
MSDRDPPITDLRRPAQRGERDAPDELFAQLDEELHRLAHKVRAGRGQTLSTTELVHEAYLKLAPKATYENRLHFFRTAAKAMRQVLVSAARRRAAGKRGGGLADVTFDERVHAVAMKVDKLVALDDALVRFQQIDPRAAQVVECRFFAGLTIEETAAALGVSPRTAKRDWRVARAYLSDELASPVA